MKPPILIVDDHLEIIQFLKEILSDDYTLFVAKNGQEALSLLKAEVIQVVISDVMMPVMDGFALCKTIKTDHELSHIPVVLLTAKTTLQSKVEGLELGADIYIDKPFSPKHLLAQVSSLLCNRSKLKEYFSNSPLAHLKNMAYTRVDEVFLETLNKYIIENINNIDLDVSDLAFVLHMSRPTFYRKINHITNLTPKELINLTRLKKSAALLLEGKHKISEIASLVGFSSQSYFNQSFIKQFRMTPSEFIQIKKSEL